MSVNPMKWKTRSLAYAFLGILAFYLLFLHRRTHHVTFEATIKNVKPEQVWNFVADFSNMKKLNPTIEEFDIISESGNYGHWKYSARYTERLSHVPYIRNNAHGHFDVRPDGEGFSIDSEHRTCFFSTVGCLDSVSRFTFHGEGRDTKCVEAVRYECPAVFSILCYKEVMYQRQKIMGNLKKHFSISNVNNDSDK